MHLGKEVTQKHPGLSVAVSRMGGLIVRQSKNLPVRLEFTGDELDEFNEIIEYRAFFRKMGFDPDKHVPPAEALIKHVLDHGEIPQENTLIDSCNLASVKHGIPVAVFDSKKLAPGLVFRTANKKEKFQGQTVKKTLTGREVVLSDQEQIVYLYALDYAKNMACGLSTTDCVVMACGVPGIKKERVVACLEEACKKIANNCSGHYEGILVLA
jgi:DNA/RNA-binding domain of Phe-tRNA-synthetase-like protein